VNVVVVAVNWRLAPPEIQHILDDAGARLLLTTGDYLGHVEGMDLPTVERIILLGDDGSDEPGSSDDHIPYAD
jgi:long-chain acyl-CoA synthetase